ncbi:glycerophosphodiester phosphodiesterase family protein [Streptomyces sp. NPDC059874]|uniref:glycerophosphodiester phosphodiesterase family protein n=1 Tax=Streptomyces sp. NPDC059874 TaxID=3346983 RepID=UPI003659ADE5
MSISIIPLPAESGTVGAPGPSGMDGVDGLDGSKIYTGSTTPSSGTGVDGDFYMQVTQRTDLGVQSTSLYVWKKTGSTWAIQGDVIRGARFLQTPVGIPSSTGVAGDMVLRTDTGNIYQHNGTAWVNVGNLKGPTGATGATGPVGPRGDAGATVHTGSSTPSTELGVDGDLYMQTTETTYLGVTSTTVNHWLKSAGAWAKIGNDVRGAAWYVSATSISSATTKPGDLALRTDSGNLFQRGESNWGDPIGNLKGPAGPAGPTGPRGPAGPAGAETPVVTVADMLAESSFYIAHRGSGCEYPEHTMAAYESIVAAGAKYIEVSVNITDDGTLVCIHDTTLDRTTNATGPVSSRPYSDLRANVRTDLPELLGPNTTGERLPTLREVLDRFIGKVVIFLEAKSNQAVDPMRNMLVNCYPNFEQSVIFKAYYTSGVFAWAKSVGMTTWGYVDAGTTDAQADTYGANIDMWGLPYDMTDVRMAAFVARGKPCISWEVHRRSEAARLSALGVKGKMSAQWLYLTRNTPFGTSDNFASKVKSPGMIGLAGYDTNYTPRWAADGSIYFENPTNRTLLMGRISNPTPPASYKIQFDMKWDVLPTALIHSGIAFGKVADDEYRFSFANPSGGYHIVMRASGNLQLYSHTQGLTSGTMLAQSHPGTVPPELVPVAGQWMSFEVEVTATQVIVRRTDVASTPVTITSNNTTHRGGYIHLSTGSVVTASQSPRWRNVKVI